MPGTILKDDLQGEIERQLREHANQVVQFGQGVAQQAQQAVSSGQQALGDIQSQLNQHVDQVVQFGQQAQQQAQQAQQQTFQVLNDYADQVSSQAPQAVNFGPAPQPGTPPAPQPQPAAAPLGGPAQPPSLPHNEEPATQSDNLGGRWKTQFDFGSTYTGDYRTGTPHRGVDLVPANGAGIGSEVDAFAPGTVTLIQRDSGAGGLMVYVKDDQGLTHAYMHLAGTVPGLAVGQRVERGQAIAQMGESGTEGSPHLHYEVRRNAAVGDPLNELIDPRPYVSGQQQPGRTTATQQQAAPPVLGGVQQAVTRIGQGKDDFINSLAPLAAQYGQSTGIDPAVFLSIAANETGWGQSQTAQKLNNLFSIQGSGAGGRWAGYDSPGAAFQAFVDLVSQAPRYAQAWADRHNPLQFVEDLRRAGYVVDEPGYPAQGWVDQVGSIYSNIKGQVDQAVQGAPKAPPVALGGVTRPNDVIDLGGTQQAAAAPLSIDRRQPPELGAQEQKTPFQVIQDQVDALQRQLDTLRTNANAVQPPLAEGQPARQAIEQGVSNLGEAAQQYLVRGGRTPDEQAQYRAKQASELQRLLDEQHQRDLQPITPAVIGENVVSMLTGANPGMGISWAEYRQQQDAKNQWLEHNNPLNNVPVAGPALGMLTTGIAQALTDPLALVTLGPTMGLGRAVGAGVGEAVMSRTASRFVSQVAERLTTGGLVGGLQNAQFVIDSQPNASPEDVAGAFLIGAGLGAGVDLAAPVLRNIGGRVLDGLRSEPVQTFLRSRQRGEAEVNAALGGIPSAVEGVARRVRGKEMTPEEAAADAAARLRAGPQPPDRPIVPRFQEVPRESAPPPAVPPAGVQREAEYPAGQIESQVQDIMRQSRSQSPDGLAHVNLNDLGDDVMPFNTNAQPGQGRVIKLNPGGMPTMDDLRALYDANEHKRSFYTDQGDEAANIVGPDNTGEFFTLNSITSMQTGVSRQVAEAIQNIGLVRQVARDGRAQGLSAPEIRQNILDALNDNKQNTLAGKSINNKRKAILEAYSTGEAAVSSGAKTSTFAGNYGSAEGRFFDPRVTNDIHNWRIMNVASDELPSLRKNKKTGEYEWFYDRPHEKNAANNDQAYRAVEAVMNELAREKGIDGYAVQSAMWDGMRAMQLRDPTSYALWQQGFFKRAIDRARSRGVFGSVTDAIDNPGDIQAVMQSAPVQRELQKWGAVLKDPLPPELEIGNTVQRSYPGKGRTAALRRPSTLALREQERPLAESNAPLVHGLDRATARQLGVDESRGIFPWLEASHRVVPIAPDEYAVHLPAGNEDTARYVASVVGQAADAPRVRIHVPDRNAQSVAGVYFRGNQDEVAALQSALDNMGVPTIRGTGGASLQVPLQVAGRQSEVDAVIDAAQSVGVDAARLNTYTGRTADVPRSEYAATQQALSSTFGPTTAGRSDLLQRGLGAVPERPAATGASPFGGRQRGEAYVPFSTQLGGAAIGGAAGYAYPADTPEERLRNLGIGASVGLLGTAGLTRGGGRLAEALAARSEGRPGFRAPESPELRATTERPTGGPGEGGTRQPRTLREVRSNRYALREAQAGETPMTVDEMVQYGDDLEQRLQSVQERRDAIDEMLRNPGQKIDRPPWAAELTNDQVAQMARHFGASPYEEAWYDRLGLEPGSGEVQKLLRETAPEFERGSQLTQKEKTPAELRQEMRDLSQEAADITAAYDQMANAPAGARLRRVEAAPTGTAAELPFDVGEGAARHGPAAVEGDGPSGTLAEDMVTNNGTAKRPSGLKTLWNEPGGVGGTVGGVTGHGISDAVATATGLPKAEVERLMPNLNALLKDAPPEVTVQIQKAVEDNPDLFAAYQQGRISHASLVDDLARKVGMTTQDWLKTPIGKGFSTPELVALQAAAVDAVHNVNDMAREILSRGGVDNLSPEEVAFGLRNLVDTTGLLATARGARSTQGRSLNALKIQFDRQLARDVTGANELKAARREASKARAARTRAKVLLDRGRDLETEAAAAKAHIEDLKRNATQFPEMGGPLEQGQMPGTPPARERVGNLDNLLKQIDQAYAELDKYNAMSLHEKADVQDALKAKRAELAANRKSVLRSAPEELLAALKAELKAEQENFAKRRDNWETQAFWDSKAAEKAAEKRRGFRGQLYLEQARKAADIAARNEETRATRSWESRSRLEAARTERAKTILEAIGGEAPSRELLKAFTEAAASDDPMVAAKFLKGLTPQRSGFANFVEMARNANIMRLAGMLSSTATHLINVGGNGINVPLELATHQATIGVDIARSALTGGERQAYQAEMLPMLKGWFKPDGSGLGTLSSLKNVIDVLSTGVSPSEVADLSSIRPGFRTYIPGGVGRTVDAAIEMPLRLLQAEDMVFRGRAFGMHAQRVAIREATREGFRGVRRTGRANNIIANLEDYPELYKEAADAAARMVLQERRTVPGVSGVRLPGTAGEAAGLAVSQVVPFRKTPINITAQGLGLSPLGLAGVAEAVGERSAIARRVAAGELPTSRLGKQTLLAEQRIARATIGTAILATGYFLGTQHDDQGRPKHMLTAMYDEDEASTYPQGWRAWSLRTENPANGQVVYTPLQNLGVIGAPLAMAAILADADRRGKKAWSDEKELARAAAGIGRYALDTPFLQGLSDVVDLLNDPGRAGTKFIEGLAASYGPYSGMGRQIQRAQGVASRNPREGFQMLVDAMEANYPGLSANVPEATTPLGEPRTQGATGFGALAGRYDIERDNPTLQALRSAGVRVPDAPKSINVGRGYGIELTEAERDQVKRARGAAIVQAVEKERAKPRMQAIERDVQTALPDSARYREALARYNAALQATVSGAAQSANNGFIRQLGRQAVADRMKPMRDVEPFYLGPPGAAYEAEAVGG